ncbi:MAG: type II secretion system F family protein [Thermoguttaceae bacterium]
MVFAESLISFPQLLPVALFGLFAVAAWWLLGLVANDKPRALERLAELKNPRARRAPQADALLKRSDPMTKVLERAGPALAAPLQPKSEAEQGKLKMKMTNAGFRGEGAAAVFLGLKLVGLMAALVLGGGTVIGVSGINRQALLTVATLAMVLFYLPDLIVGFIAKSRKQAIFLSLPDALDLLVVCVEAGLGLDHAMRKVSDEMKRTHRVLSEEFALTNFHLQMGRARSEVLHELGMRTGVSDLRSLAAVLIQADKFGSSIAQALRVQSESLRIRRRQLAEEKAAKTAVKLIFPLVLFIFPGIFVVLVGPAAISMVRQMFPMLQK